MFETSNLGFAPFVALALAFFLSALIGLEREIRHKSAGLRTYSVVGLSAALIMLVSKYGFYDLIITGQVSFDPSRIAAQIVSGIGFIGGGVIFMRRDIIQGLTTAASVWLTAAVGMACGAELYSLAVLTTAGHFVIMLLFPYLIGMLRRNRWLPTQLYLSYHEDPELLGHILAFCHTAGFKVDHLRLNKNTASDEQMMTLNLELRGSHAIEPLLIKLSSLPGIERVLTGDHLERDT